MLFLKKYMLPRVLQFLTVVFVGITLVFIVIRMLPVDPVKQVINTFAMFGATIDPAATELLTQTLRELYGLEGTIYEQYFAFWSRLFRGDFGPSLFIFPVPVIDLIATAMPWTAGLLILTTFFSWLFGTVLGGLAGYFQKSTWAKLLDKVVMVLRPIPFYIFALLMLILFAYLVPIFPLGGGIAVGTPITFSWKFISDLVRHAALPALSMGILGSAVWFQTMRLIVQGVTSEDFVVYAKAGGLKKNTIAFKYVIRNAILPQITALGLSLGQIFSGALIVEIVFAYPGIGSLLNTAIINGDYNVIMAITTLSIATIATLILIVDLLYPLFDPQVRFK